ncbi:hypothetical protein EV182_005879, partial [Spiromyces aspiralis]
MPELAESTTHRDTTGGTAQMGPSTTDTTSRRYRDMSLWQATRFIAYNVIFFFHCVVINGVQLIIYAVLCLLNRRPAIDTFNLFFKHQFGGTMAFTFRIWAPTQLVLTAEDTDGSDFTEELRRDINASAKDKAPGCVAAKWLGDFSKTKGSIIIANHQARHHTTASSSPSDPFPLRNTPNPHAFLGRRVVTLAYMEDVDKYIKIILKYELRKLPILG